MHELIEPYLQWIEARGYSPRTLRIRRQGLEPFVRWCRERGLQQAGEVTQPVLERYQHHLYRKRKPDGEPLSWRSQYSQLTSIKVWFKWLTRQGYIGANPASELELPKRGRTLPKNILSESEAETIINQTDVTTAQGLRDRAILETLYSTGMRRTELVSLALHAVDFERGTVFIDKGKGGKDRMVPIGERALGWLGKYIEDIRPQYVVPGMDPGPGEGRSQGETLFLNRWGGPFGVNGISNLVRRYVRAAELPSGKRGACHLFRHAMATLMLERGADIRHVQAMLGHADLATTQLYTHLTINQLKQVHQATHPGSAPRPNPESDSSEGGADGE
jgi:integrase/recombinase XerD